MSDTPGPTLEEAAFALSEYCQDQFTNTYRATIIYQDDGLHAYHLRSELHDMFSETELEEYADAAWNVQAASESFKELESILGDITATTHTFEDAIAIQFPLETNGGILVAFDPSVAEQFADLLEEFWAILVGES